LLSLYSTTCLWPIHMTSLPFCSILCLPHHYGSSTTCSQIYTTDPIQCRCYLSSACLLLFTLFSERADRNWSDVLQFLPLSHINPRFPQMGYSGCYLHHAVSCLAYSLNVKMEVTCPSKMLADFWGQHSRRYNSSSCLD
jgi:hypothetical protein